MIPDDDIQSPHNLPAEQALLGILMHSSDAFYDVAESLRGLDFYEPFHQRLFDVIGSTIRRGRTPAPDLLSEWFLEDQAFIDFGGTDYLMNLLGQAPPATVAGDYADTIIDLALRRGLIAAGAEAMRTAHDRSQTALDLVMAAERTMADVSANGPIKSAFQDIGTIFHTQLEKSRKLDGTPPGISTGIHDLDKKLGGLRRKNVIVGAGRPGMGKSAAAIQICINVATPSAEAPKGRGVAFYSAEMPEEQVATRFGCALAFDRNLPDDQNPTYEDFEKGLLTPIQIHRLEEAGRKLADMPVMIDFRGKPKVSQMLASARRQKREWTRQGIEMGLVVVDHVLMVAPEKRLNDKVVEISQIADDILDMAKQLDVPILLLCQLGREVDKRDDKRPILADLKWSGSLEENAAAVIFFYRPEYYNKAPAFDAKDAVWAKHEKIKQRWTDRLLMLLEKNRNGQANQEIETFCRIGCNAIQQLAEPIGESRVLDFSSPRSAPPDDDGIFETLGEGDIR